MSDSKDQKALHDAPPSLLEEAKNAIVDLSIECVMEVAQADASSVKKDIFDKLSRPAKVEFGDVALPCFVFTKVIKSAPPKIASDLLPALSKKIEAESKFNQYIAKVEAAGPYLNFTLTSGYLSQVVPAINTGGLLNPLSNKGKARVMIEYSQPNTHKAFHVGHMRNAALGGCLVHLYEQMGHPVVAANYFGDEGAHVAKCVWLLRKKMSEEKLDLSTVPIDKRGEWLGDIYAQAVEKLDLSTATQYPNPGVYTAKVLSVGPHPAADAPANWHVVEVALTADESSKATVVCGGVGYQAGDVIAYIPVGGKLKGVAVVPKDMKGVASHGVILAERELGIESEAPPAPAAAPDAKDSKEKKSKDKNADKAQANKIFVLPADTPVGVELPEIGRSKTCGVPEGTLLSAEFDKRNKEVGAVLHGLEHGDKELCDLWNETKEWSLQEFKKIYRWLGCRFDHDFYESEVGAESIEMVKEYHKKGVVIESNGALGCDLTKYKLGFAMLLKSNGSGLYMTKDLALAKRKFDSFKIDKNVYVVDAAQSHHFSQVFKVLEMFGYEQAKNCIHLPYGLVVLPDGKMSSRKGTVVYFSQLVELLDKHISAELEKYKGVWPDEEIDEVKRAVSVGTIKYGMLNHDTARDIVFELSQWSARTGNTGPYMLYAYARIRSILRQVQPKEGAIPNFSLLQGTERPTLIKLHEFWPTVAHVTSRNNPSTLCDYLFDLAKSFSSWYENVSVKSEPDMHKQAALLQFITAIGETLKKGLSLLGIHTVERM